MKPRLRHIDLASVLNAHLPSGSYWDAPSERNGDYSVTFGSSGDLIRWKVEPSGPRWSSIPASHLAVIAGGFAHRWLTQAS